MYDVCRYFVHVCLCMMLSDTFASTHRDQITLSISNMENPPINIADADPETWFASLSEALTETDTYGLIPLNLGTESTKCSGEYGKKRQ